MADLGLQDIAAELYVRGQWQAITLEQALRLDSSRRMRCPECNGQVRAHNTGKGGQRAHMEHYHRHPGCSRGNYFEGTRSPHPRRLK